MADLCYGVELDDLMATIDDLARCGRSLDDLLAEVAARVVALHDSWEGRSALAQATAQADWEAGFAQMSRGLAVMRESAATAHENYSGAAATNLAMWEQLR
ncbi:MAG: WXG100 family type VII secretion target [Nocardioides sp.]